jgi:hypothetical protein
MAEPIEIKAEMRSGEQTVVRYYRECDFLALQNEYMEQARLNGMGSEREARLMARLAEEESSLAQCRGLLKINVDAVASYRERLAEAEQAIEKAGRCLVMSNNGKAEALAILRGYKEAADSATGPHVCGLAGYNGMTDPPCPACSASVTIRESPFLTAEQAVMTAHGGGRNEKA